MAYKKQLNKPSEMQIIVAKAGYGKTEKLLNDALSAIDNGKDVYIATPTNQLKQGLKSRVQAKLDQTVDKRKRNSLKELKGSIHTKLDRLNTQKQADVVLIDEAGQTRATDFESALFKLQNSTKVAEIKLYGDPNQIAPASGVSLLQYILNYQLLVGESKGIAYDEFIKKEIQKKFKRAKLLYVPLDYQNAIESITLKALQKNYRFKDSEQFDDVNKHFFSEVKKQAILNGYHRVSSEKLNDDTYKYYKDDLDRLFSEGYGLVVPTHGIGRAIDFVLSDTTDEANEKKAPFMRSDTKLYLNAKADKADEYAQMFPFLKAENTNKELTPSYYLTIDAVQGNQFSKVAYCLFNYDISSSTQRKHYNYNRLYTALTRGTKEFVFVGKQKTFDEMLKEFDKPDNTKTIQMQLNDAYIDDFISKFIEAGDFDYKRKGFWEDFESQWKEYANDRFSWEDVTTQALVGEFKPSNLTNVIKPLKGKFDNNNDDYFGEIVPAFSANQDNDLYTSGKTYTQKTIGLRSKGKGKVQQWFDGLSIDDLNQALYDYAHLSLRELTAKYIGNKDSLSKVFKQYINDQDVSNKVTD